MKRMP